MTEPITEESMFLQKDARMSVQDFIQTLEARRGPKSVAKPYKYLLRRFEECLLSKGKTIDSFTATDVELFMSQLPPSTANVFLNAVRQYARFRVNNATDENYVWEDRRYHSLQSIRPLRVPRKIKKEALTEEEVKMLLDLTSEDEPLHSGIVCLFYFGWRPVEATVKLREGTVNWKERYLKIETAKAKHERLLPWAEEITPYLRTWYEFVKRMKHKYPEEWLTKHLKAYNGFFSTNVTAKTARKTFETVMRKTGIPQWQISFLLGHRVDVSFVYTDWSQLLNQLRIVMEEKHYLLRVL